MDKGIPEPATPGEAAAPAALPSKAGGLGTRTRTRGRRAREVANSRRRAAGRLPERVGAMLDRRKTRYSRALML